MLIKIPESERPLVPSVTQEGDAHDKCPHCGSESKMVSTMGGKNDYVHARMYSCDVRDGGCGVPHTRTTRWGVEQDRQRGVRSSMPVTSVLVGRTVFVPSDTYRDKYEEIFGHK